MLDRVVQPVSDPNERSKQNVRPYQSLWLAHWKPTSCNAARVTCNPDASGEEVYEVNGNGDLTKGFDDSTRSVEEFRMIKSTTVEVGGEIVNVSSKSVGNERKTSSPFKYCQDTNGMQTVKPDFAHGKAVDCRTGILFPSLVNKGKAVGNSVNACLGESTTCDHCLSMSLRNTLPKMQKSSGIHLFPRHCISSEEFGRKKSKNDCYTLLKLQNCAHDVDNVDTTGTRSRVFSRSNGHISGEFHCKSPFLDRGKQHLIFQPTSSLIDSQVKENIRDLKTSNVTIRNISSAEITNMDMDSSTKTSKKNLLSGSNTTASTKILNLNSNKPPHINLALPALSGAASLSENTHRNSSKTQSLVMNKQRKSKSKFDLNDFPDADPGNKWVKRLKPTSSNSSSQGTNSSNFTSSSSHQKTTKLFNFGPNLEKQHDKKSVLPDNNWNFSKKDKDQHMENPKDKCKALLFSHAWIQRWLHNGQGITEAKPETNVVYELQSSKLTIEKLQKEHLPSIAAMALMAKVLTCFQPCELQKRGPFTIWNTKTC